MKHSPCPHWVKRAVRMICVICCLLITLVSIGQPTLIYRAAEKAALTESTGVTFTVASPQNIRANHLEEGGVRCE